MCTQRHQAVRHSQILQSNLRFVFSYHVSRVWRSHISYVPLSDFVIWWSRMRPVKMWRERAIILTPPKLQTIKASTSNRTVIKMKFLYEPSSIHSFYLFSGSCFSRLVFHFLQPGRPLEACFHEFKWELWLHTYISIHIPEFLVHCHSLQVFARRCHKVSLESCPEHDSAINQVGATFMLS